MPKLDLDLSNLSTTRQSLNEAQAALQHAQAAVTSAQFNLRSARGEGASAAEVATLNARLIAAEETARRQNRQRGALLDEIRLASDHLLFQRDPAEMVAALDGAHPVLMLPVRIETKFEGNPPQRLRIRIYPDIVHLQQHEPRLLPKEVLAGQAYWQARFQDTDSALAWDSLVQAYRPPRAAWIVQQTTPGNLDQMGVSLDDELATPEFAEVAIRGEKDAKEARAMALPDRFVAIGYKHGQEVFRVWGANVPDTLPLSFDFNYLDKDNPDVYSGDRAWLADYEAARAVGMGIAIEPRHLQANFFWQQGVDRLIVLGVDWTQTPEAAAALVGTLLDAHQNSHGLQFVAPGAPTNQTATARSGYQPYDPAFAASLDPAPAAAPLAIQSAGAQLQQALGLSPKVFDLAHISGAELTEDALAEHMINALWRATLGYTLDYFWNPLEAENSLISDEAIAKLRNHALRYLRPSGVFPTLRIGRQPYGILPICAPAAWQADPTSQVEIKLTALTHALRVHWQNAVDNPDASKRPPRIDRPDGDTLKAVLGSLPWSQDKRFRRVAGESVTDKTPELKAHHSSQATHFSWLRSWLFLALGTSTPKRPYFGTLTQDPHPDSLAGVPWVQTGEDDAKTANAALAPAANYIAQLLGLIDQPSDSLRAPLAKMQDGNSLLEAMLAMAADEELLKAGEAFFYSHLRRTGYASEISSVINTYKLGVHETLAIDSALKVGDSISLDSSAALFQLKLNGTTAGKTLEVHLAEHLRLNLDSDKTAQLVALKDSLAFLQSRSVAELRRAFASTLDAYGYRLDAWITSLTQRRLAQLRSHDHGKSGLHLGAFAFVENLLPDDPDNPRHKDSLGYTHAPSVPQAVAAAILRSGHVANREAAAGAFNIDLRSRRVKRAQRLLEGMANGQSQAALLGYRFERGLRDHQPTLAGYTREFRSHYPLRRAGEVPGDKSVEAIAARDVADGISLLDAARAPGGYVLPEGFAAMSATELASVRALLAELADLFDGLADLLVAESVYQLSLGNLERAGAALAVLDKQERAVEPRVAATARNGRAYTQRVLTLSAGADAGAWTEVSAMDPRAQAEPRLNAWLARVLGDPARYRLRATCLGVPDDEKSLEINLLELGLSPLSLVLFSQPDQAQARSLLQNRLARIFSAHAPLAATGLVIESAGAAGFLGLAEWEAQAQLLRALITQSRPLRRTDLILVQDAKENGGLDAHGEYYGIDEIELSLRADNALNLLGQVGAPIQAALAALPDPLPAPDDPGYAPHLSTLLTALAPAALLASPEALPTQADASASLADWQARGLRVLADVTNRLLRARTPLAAEEDTFPRRVDHAIAQIKAVFGKDFPVLPQFTMGAYAAEFAAVQGDRDSLLAGDALVPPGWLAKMGYVREGVARLAQTLGAAQALGVASAASDYQVLQFPRPTDGSEAQTVWAALAKPDAKNRVQIALLAYAPDLLEPPRHDTPLAGLFVDEWSELIPEPEQNTGIAFHFDAPGARAPQTMLLAVPPRLDMAHWDFDLLLASVNEAFDLAKIRAVRPQDLEGGLGQLLPLVFLPDNFSKDVPTVHLGKLVAKAYSQLAGSAVYQAAGSLPQGKF